MRCTARPLTRSASKANKRRLPGWHPALRKEGWMPEPGQGPLPKAVAASLLHSGSMASALDPDACTREIMARRDGAWPGTRGALHPSVLYQPAKCQTLGESAGSVIARSGATKQSRSEFARTVRAFSRPRLLRRSAPRNDSGPYVNHFAGWYYMPTAHRRYGASQQQRCGPYCSQDHFGLRLCVGSSLGSCGDMVQRSAR